MNLPRASLINGIRSLAYRLFRSQGDSLKACAGLSRTGNAECGTACRPRRASTEAQRPYAISQRYPITAFVKAAIATAATLLLVSCSSPEETTSETTTTDGTYNTGLNVAELMTLVLEPASDILWDSGGWILDSAGLEELFPTTDEGWDYVLAQAAVVVESGNMLALPGRAEDNDAWMIYTEGLSAAGMAAMESAAAHDEEAFFQAGAQIYSVCTACHQAYNPDILNAFDVED